MARFVYTDEVGSLMTATPAPPPPPPPAAAYAPAPSQSTAPAPVKLPAWLDIGMILIGVGALLILVGFIFGDAASGQFANGTLATYQSDMEFFFVLSGVGIFLAIGGWMVHVIMPQWQAQRNAAAVSPGATSAATMPAPPAPPVTPVAAPAAPDCANCGKPTTYIAQYGRYYCYSCGRYV